MVKMPTRIVIYVKDIIAITGKSECTARRIMAAIKKKFGRTNRGGVSIDDFCSFIGFTHETVKEHLR